MSIKQKTAVFIICFSALFYFVRLNDYYNTKILIADLGGIPWLYSTIGVVFSVIAAFVIQKEWDNWNSLVESAQNEVDSLEELWLWTEHLPAAVGKDIKRLIAEYLRVVISEGWRKSERGERSDEAEHTLFLLRGALFGMSEKTSYLASKSTSLFSDILKYRRDRIHFSARYMPNVLRYTLIFSMDLLIFLSLLVGIKNIWLDYIFTLSIATLVYAVYAVIVDLDHPLRPGGWHLTTKDYKDLLERVKTAAY